MPSCLSRTPPPTPPPRWAHPLPRLSRPYTAVLAEAFACAILMRGLGISTSYFIQPLVASVLVRHEARLLNALGLGMVLIALFRTLFGLLRQYLVAHVGRKVD